MKSRFVYHFEFTPPIKDSYRFLLPREEVIDFPSPNDECRLCDFSLGDSPSKCVVATGFITSFVFRPSKKSYEVFVEVKREN